MRANIILKAAQRGIHSGVVALAASVILAPSSAGSDVSAVTSRQIRLTGAGLDGTLFSDSFPDGRIELAAGAFTEWIDLPDDSVITLYQTPPDADGNFSNDARPITIELVGVPRQSIVLSVPRWAPSVALIPDSPADTPTVTIVNLVKSEFVFRLGEQNGRVRPGGHVTQHLRLPSGPANSIVALSLISTDAETAIFGRASDARLRVLADHRMMIVVSPAFDPGTGSLGPGISMHVIYEPVFESEP